MCLKMYLKLFYRNYGKADWQYLYMFILLHTIACFFIASFNSKLGWWCLVGWRVGWLMDWLIASFVHWFIGFALIGFDLILFWSDLIWFDLIWLGDLIWWCWLNGRTNWRTYCMNERRNEWQRMEWNDMAWHEMKWSEWMNECMNERTHEFMTWYDRIAATTIELNQPILCHS